MTAGPSARSQSPAAPRQRLVVYTALVGAKEPLNNPLEILPANAGTDLALDFVCITDDATLTSPVWRFMLLPTAHLPPEKLSRRPKALPHEYFPDAQHSLYIDNTVCFKRLPQASDLATDQPYLFRAFRHARHTQLAQEAFAIAMLGYEDVGIICQQLDFYASRGALDAITPLTTATVLLRQHHHPAVQQFGRVWWENILAFAKRDQLSFDFALRQAGAEVDYLPGITRDNPFIRWQGSLAATRLRASFDDRRYAWLHRAEPGAAQDPKAHALRQGRGADAGYQRPLQVLELLCWQQGSSLGSQVAPRRGLAAALEPLLMAHRQPGSRFVIVRVQGNSDTLAFSAAEFESAGRALATFLGAGAEGTLLDLPMADLLESSKVYSAGQQPPFDLVLVLGLPGSLLVAAVQKLVRLVAPARGSLLLALTSPAPLAEAARAEAVALSVSGRALTAALQASRHDDLAQALPNSLVALQWPLLATSGLAAAAAAATTATTTAI